MIGCPCREGPTYWQRLDHVELRRCAEWCRVGRTFAEAEPRTRFMAECEQEYALLFKERGTGNVDWPLLPRRKLCANAFSLEKIKVGIPADVDALRQLTPGSPSTEQWTQQATAPASSTAPSSQFPNADTNVNTNLLSDFSPTSDSGQAGVFTGESVASSLSQPVEHRHMPWDMDGMLPVNYLELSWDEMNRS